MADTCQSPTARRIGSETYVQIGLVITLVSAVAWGASEVATLRAVNEAQTGRIVALEAKSEARAAADNALERRLARIETLLEQLVQAKAGYGGAR